jgi:putative ABC transport system substrate-binding protein
MLLISLFSGLLWARSAVVVLKSDDLPEYEAPIASFNQQLGRPIQVFDLHGDRSTAERVVRGLASDPPPLILALGARAAWIARQELPGVPLVYALVFDPERYGITGAQVTGVQMEVAPDIVLGQFQLFAPRVRRIGLLISTDNSDEDIKIAIETAKRAGMEVVARRVASEDDVRRAFANVRRSVDAIWLLPDPAVVTPTNFHYIIGETRRSRMPVLVWSRPLVEAGALLCVAPDYAQVGVQAGDLALQILNGATPGTLSPPSPEGFRVVLNRDTLEALGLKVDESALDFVDEVVREPSRR